MNAWIDAAGTLRQTDYIADSQGYRILKSKTLYVGVGTPIVVSYSWLRNVINRNTIELNFIYL